MILVFRVFRGRTEDRHRGEMEEKSVCPPQSVIRILTQ